MLELVGWSAAILTQVFWIPNIARIVRGQEPRVSLKQRGSAARDKGGS
jgi:uncharacterized protein with PQ loop repeat